MSSTLYLNANSREIAIEGVKYKLTPQEFDVVQILASEVRYFSPREIYEAMHPNWPEVTESELIVVRVIIRRIREKTYDEFIVNRIGIGYRINEELMKGRVCPTCHQSLVK